MPISDKVKKLLNKFSSATIKAAMNESPAVMQAAGWDYDKDGNLVQGDPNAEGPTKLRESLDAISFPVFLDNVGNVAGAAVMGIPAVRNAVLSTKAANMLKSAKVKNGTVKTDPDKKEIFRSVVYKGGEITDPYYASFSTDPRYAAQYGNVKKYLIDAPSPSFVEKPIIGTKDVVTNDMMIYDATKGKPGSKVIVGHDAVTGEFPHTSEGIEVVSLSPNNISELPEEYVLPPYDFVSRSGAYSGYTPTMQKRETSFVNDVNEAVAWAKARGLRKPNGTGYIQLYPRDYIGNGAESYVYTNPANRGEVLKVMHGSATPGKRKVQLPDFETPDEAISWAEEYLKDRNNRPYNLVESIAGVTDNGAEGYAPVLSQKKVTVAKNNTVRAPRALMDKFEERVRLNNISSENDFQIPIYDKFLDKYIMSGHDFRADNVGVLNDGSLIGIDLFGSGGKIHINPANRGKFNATKKRTGKTTEELTHSSNPLTRKRAIFAQNAAKWNHKHADGGPLGADYTKGYIYPAPDSIIVKKPKVDIPVVTVEEPVAPAIDLEELKKRQYFIESKFNDKAVNKHSGAMGAYQIMPITLKDYTQRTGETGDLYDYAFNEKVRDFYMNRYLNSSWATKNNQSEYNRAAKALAAYNWGPGNLIKYLEAQKKAGVDIYNGTDWLKGLPGETRNYIKWTLDGEDIGMRTTNAGYEKAKKKRFDFGGYIGDLVEQSGGDREKILEAIKNIKASRK